MGLAGGDGKGNLEDAKERGVSPDELGLAFGVGEDDLDFFLVVDEVADEGFDFEAIGGFKIGVADVFDAGGGGDVGNGEAGVECGEVKFGDFGADASVAGDVGVDDHTETRNGLDATFFTLIVINGFGENGGVLTTGWDVFWDGDGVFDDLFLAGGNGELVSFKGDPARNLGEVGLATKVWLVIVAGDGVGRSVDFEREIDLTGVFDGHFPAVLFAGVEGDAFHGG